MVRRKVRQLKRPKVRHTLKGWNPVEDAEFFARLYLTAKSEKRRSDVIEMLMMNSLKYDIITKSCAYYGIFEKLIGSGIDKLWGGGTSAYGKSIDEVLSEYEARKV